jgi:hypothetical protein
VDESTTTSNLVRREEGIEKYVQGVLKLRDAAHAKAVEELAAKHKLEADRLRAKAAEPVNEFRVAKQFHIKEAELKSEARKLQGQLDVERVKSGGMEFAQVERVDDMRMLKELRLRCADRDRLAAEVQELKDERERRSEPYRCMEAQELLGMIDVLKVSAVCVSSSLPVLTCVSGEARHRRHRPGRRHGCGEEGARRGGGEARRRGGRGQDV